MVKALLVRSHRIKSLELTTYQAYHLQMAKAHTATLPVFALLM